MRLRAFLQRLCLAREGTSLVELTIVLPTMLVLYLLAYTLCDALACSRKVTIATRELTDLTSRYMSLQVGDVANLLNATTQILGPYIYDTAHATVRISEVQVTDTTHASVVWTCTNAASNVLSKGTSITLPGNMVDANTMVPGKNSAGVTITGAYFIVGEAAYRYTPVFQYLGMGGLNFQERIFLVPRSTLSVPLSNPNSLSSPVCSL